MNRQSIHSLKGIASNPQFPNSFERLWFQADVPEVLRFDDWLLRTGVNLYNLHPRSEGKSSSTIGPKAKFSDQEVQMHWKKYQGLVEDVNTMLEDGTIRDSFCSLFNKCPKLTNVDFTMAN
ncbi:hypothetical protein P171DRAFT_404298 [Karstenula rhodostoma CBS 690.94]|uniref:Uncharacterized protein n=1 Tax=Karstenula rhodostoma CBS 690.94 TaxID=1392251 RepID=A0A9P4PRR7_9PLEO|nr:hypothetical protein P171DRAFT_404298 [Karstenula rhodostoma CBS 690.94]